MDTLSPEPHPDIQQKKIIRIYLLFGVSLILSLVPDASAALISAVLAIAVLVIAYAVRNDAEDGSLLENHMTFIIRTIWICSFLALVAMSVAAVYLFKFLDNTPLQPCVNSLLSMANEMNVPDMNALNTMMASDCWTNYWHTNLNAFIISGAIAAGPVVIYLLVRFTRGFTRAKGGYRLADPKAWF